MPNNVLYTPLALDDFEAIHDYIYSESRSERIADSIIERIEATARNFATQPRAGAECEYFPGSRYFVVRK